MNVEWVNSTLKNRAKFVLHNVLNESVTKKTKPSLAPNIKIGPDARLPVANFLTAVRIG